MKNKIVLDVLLLPVELFKKITNRMSTFCLGAVIVGGVDVLLLFVENFDKIMMDKSAGDVLLNLALTCVLVVVIGFLDVIFFSFPLVDLVKFLKKQRNLQDKSSAVIKFSKVYIISHFIIIPVQLVLYICVKWMGVDNLPYLLLLIISLIDLAVPFWAGAIITRGANALFKFEDLQKFIFFIVTMLWSELLGYALNFLLTFAGKFVYGLWL